MRKRAEIEKDGKRVDMLSLEVLLDIRALLEKPPKPKNRRSMVTTREKRGQ